MTLAKVRDKWKYHLKIIKENKSDTFQRKDNMKMTVIKVNENKNYSCKHKSDTYENKGALKW